MTESISLYLTRSNINHANRYKLEVQPEALADLYSRCNVYFSLKNFVKIEARVFVYTSAAYKQQNSVCLIITFKKEKN